MCNPQVHLGIKQRQPASQQAATSARTEAKQVTFAVAEAAASGEPCRSAIEQQPHKATVKSLRRVCSDGPVGTLQDNAAAVTAAEQQQIREQQQQQQEQEQWGVCRSDVMRTSDAKLPDDAAGELSSVSCFSVYEPDQGSFAFPAPSVRSPAPASPGLSHSGTDQAAPQHLILPALTTSACHTTSALVRQLQHQQAHLIIPTTPACSLHDAQITEGDVEQMAAAKAEEVGLVASPPEKTAPVTSLPGLTAPVASPAGATPRPQAHRRAAAGCNETAVVRVHSTPFSVRSAAEFPWTKFIHEGLVVHSAVCRT